ncbi:MAG: DUF1080 domain-containing protein [Planctomycetales bacterium]|nr:DUF1080 domain-containing protein [Planctomycetales bacterium]
MSKRRRTWRTHCLFLRGWYVAATLLAASVTPCCDVRGAVSLFNGVDLTGWTKLGGDATYSVDGDAIVGLSDPASTSNTFLVTENSWGDFALDADFWIADPSFNSGIQLRSASLPEHNAGRVFGYQAEIDPSTRAWTGGLYFEGGSPDRPARWLDDLSDNPAAQAAFVLGVWNHLRVVAKGTRIQTWINGVAAADYVDDDPAAFLSSGFIGLQVHQSSSATPLEVRWRNLVASSLPTLRVNRATGEVQLTSDMDLPVELRGYSIGSPSGSLTPSADRWQGFAAAGEPAWSATAADATLLAEATAAAAFILNNGDTHSLGRVYAPKALSFGVNEEDLTLQFSEGGPSQAGLVEYFGPNFTNNLVLFVDPDTGEAILKNTSPLSVPLTGYSITSTAASLAPEHWSSLVDQSFVGWDAGAESATALAELSPHGELTLAAGDAIALGAVYSPQGAADLMLQFLLADDERMRVGAVWYRRAADFNLDDDVDGVDLAVWQAAFGVSAAADANGDGASDGADLLSWQRQYAGAAADVQVAPEPTAAAQSLCAVMAVVIPWHYSSRLR